MRTLKKTLALVLVVAMMMSLCITSNAAFTDADKIEYTEAVEVMTAIGVIEGFPAGDFQPQGSLTRAQAAKILVYILDAVDYAKADGQIFDDVKEGHWAADYIAYCAEEGLVNGYGDGNFGPEDKLTAYQWAKMLLAALGEDTSAMIGAAWQIPVAKAAASYGIFADNEKADKTEICTREEACLYALNALKYGEARGYAVFNGEGYAVAFYPTVTEASHAALALGAEYTISTRPVVYGDTSLLKLAHGVNFISSSDAWGRPGVLYFNSNYSIYLPYTDEYEAVFYTATTECDIATAAGLRYAKVYDLYVNGTGYEYAVQPTDTVQAIGAQGTRVEVYEDVIVVIDTFLAKVEAVTPVTYDKAGHKISDASIKLTVYNTEAGTTVMDYSPVNYSYAKGDMVLVNAYTTESQQTNGTVVVNGIDNTYSVAEYVEILGLAKTMVGAQTFLWYNAERHTIDGVDYTDAAWFELDQADYETTDHTWYFDQYGNVIGATDIATVYAYGIIEDIQWINPVGSKGYAQATIRYMDGTTETKVVEKIEGKSLAYASIDGSIDSKTEGIYTDIARNADMCGDHLYRIETQANGTLLLTHVATYSTAGTWVSKNEIGKASINPYGTANALSAITNGTNTIYVNANTVFLVQTDLGYAVTYSVVTGYQNMDKYTNCATVDWVNLNGDSYADYVYVIGEPDDATSRGLFMLTNPSVKVVPDNYGNVYYYEVTGLLNGVEQTIMITNSTAYNTIASNLYQMSSIEVKNGFVVNAWNLEVYDGTLDALGAAYTGLNQEYAAASTTAGSITKKGDVLHADGKYFNVAGLTPVVGEWADDMSGKNVYVVYDRTKTIAGAYVAKAVYVINTGDSDYNSAVVYPTASTLALELNGKTVEASYKNNSGNAQNVTVVYTYRVSGSNSGYATYASAAYTVASGAVEVWSKDTLTLPTGSVAQMYEVVATAYVNGVAVASATANYLA